MNVARPVENDVDMPVPNSAPPSFRSRASTSSSRRAEHDDIRSDAERMLAETFNDGEVSEGEQEASDDRQRLIHRSYGPQANDTRSHYSARLNRRMTEIPSFVNFRPANTNAARGRSQNPSLPNLTPSNDGVFANLDAKPELGEKLEEQPPVRQSDCIACLADN